MPNQNGFHSKENTKLRFFPPAPGRVLGFTGELGKYPTVYFTGGHWTQTHKDDWNVGWESYDGWECKFFGNVLHVQIGSRKDHNGKPLKVYLHSSNRLDGSLIETKEYLETLKDRGRNRYLGPGNWDLHKGLDDMTKPLRLREFWIRDGTDGNSDETRFAHASHHGLFTPVLPGDQNWQNLMNELPTKGTFFYGGGVTTGGHGWMLDWKKLDYEVAVRAVHKGPAADKIVKKL